jgi:cell division protein FtsB
MAAVQRLNQSVVEQSAVNQALVGENTDLEAEILDLRRLGEAAEERARSELGLTYPNETFFQIAEVDD